MKNYYDQQHELNIAVARKKTLEEKRQIYFYKTQPKATIIKDVVVMVDPSHDIYVEYMAKVEKIDNQLHELDAEIKILERDLAKMQEELKNMKSNLTKVFVDVYVDGLTVKQTALKENFSTSHIYTLLSEIKRIIHQR